MNKIKAFFGIFFLTFLFVCSVPTICKTVSWMKVYYFRQFDMTMQKYYTRYFKPAAETDESLYAPQKQILFWKLPWKEKDYSADYICIKICQSLLSLPEQKEFEKQLSEAFPFRIVFSEISMAFRKLVGMKIPIEYSRHYLRPDGSLGLLPLTNQQYFPLKRIFDTENTARKVNAEFHVVIRPHNIPDVASKKILWVAGSFRQPSQQQNQRTGTGRYFGPGYEEAMGETSGPQQIFLPDGPSLECLRCTGRRQNTGVNAE